MHPSSVDHITTRATQCFESGATGLQTRHISGVLWACAKMKVAPPSLVDAVLARAGSMQLSWYKPVEVSMTVWAIGKLGLGPETGGPQFVSKLTSFGLSRAHAFDSQGLSNLASGLSSVGLAPSELPLLLCAVRDRLHEFSAQEVANTLAAFAKLPNVHLDECDRLSIIASDVIRARLPKFTTQQLANTAWAIAKLLEGSGASARETLDFWALLAPDVERRAMQLNAQELSMSCWAAAQAMGSWTGTQAPVKFEKMMAAAATRMTPHMDAQQLATIALSLVKLGCTNPITLKSIAKASRRNLHAFKPQDLDNLASAYARLGTWNAPKLVAAIAAAGAATLNSRGRPDSQLVDELTQVGSFPARNLVNLVWAVAKLRAACCAHKRHTVDKRAAKLADAAAQELCLRMDVLNARDLSNVAWAFATLGNVQGVQRECMVHIGRRSARIVDTFNAQECSKLLFAFGKSGVQSPELEGAAAAERDLSFEFATGTVVLRGILGGARFDSGGLRPKRREGTKATAGTGGALWEDAYVLAEWLARQRSPAVASATLLPTVLRERTTWHGLQAVELGAGLGLCSIVAQQLGMHVIATDGYDDVLALLSANAASAANTTSAGDAVRVAPLMWGTPSPIRQLNLHAPPDVLMATGCVYGADTSVFEALVQTLVALSGPHTLVLMCHGNGAAPGVHRLSGPFYDLLEPHFESARIAQHTLHAEHQGCQIHCLRRLSSLAEKTSQKLTCARKRAAHTGEDKHKKTRGDAEKKPDECELPSS